MRLPRGVVQKRDAYFARLYAKGGEHSFPLGPDPDVAVERFRYLQAALRDGADPEALREGIHLLDGLTVAQAVERWLRDWVDLELEPRNASMIRSRVGKYLLPHLGTRALRSLRRTDCHAFKAHLRRERPELTAGALRHYLRDLRELLYWCEEMELLDQGWTAPWPKKRILPKPDKTPPRRFTEEEVKALKELQEPYGFTLRFLLSTGLRWGEACRAPRRDIEDGQLLVRESKTGEPRLVRVPKSLLAEIMRRGIDRLCPFGERSSGVFNKQVSRMVGFQFNAHACRHTYATRYLEANGDLLVLQRNLGHSSVVMTEHYGRLGDRHAREDSARVFETWESMEARADREQKPGTATNPRLSPSAQVPSTSTTCARSSAG